MSTIEVLDSAPILDVQGLPDSREIVINKVGIKGIRHPLSIAQADGKSQHTIAMCNLYVSLTAAQKGTHMSRFIEILNAFDTPITPDSLRDLLTYMIKHLNTDHAYFEFSFPYFRSKKAPISGVESLSDYDVLIKGEMVSGTPTLSLQVTVPVTSLCPCSKEISKYGAHNQRSHMRITLFNADELWIEDVIAIAEKEASCEVYGLLKRPDEKYVTEKAYENPKFVEDMVRDVAAVLNADPRVPRYQVTAENFESIHNHSAFALIEN